MKYLFLRKSKARTLLVIYMASAIFIVTSVTLYLVYFRIKPFFEDTRSLLQLFLPLSILLVAAVLLISLIGSILYRRLIDVPLKQMKQKALEIAVSEDALGAQIPEPLGEELQELTRAFNTMSASLKQSRDEIEGKVAERTKLVEEGSRLVQEVLDTTPNLLCLMNTEIDQFNYLNREFCDFFEMENQELLHLGPDFLRGRIHPSDRMTFKDHEKKLLKNKDEEVTQSDFRVADAHGNWRWVSMRSIIFQRNRENKPKLVLHVGQDISNLKQTEEKLRFLSIHDQLTGIYNRLYFEEEIARLERGRHYPITTIMTDLDNLKTVNDSYGHCHGDEILKTISGILKSSFRAEDVVARIGGDEFAALLPGTDVETADKIVQRILERIQNYNTINQKIPIHVSIGFHTVDKGESLAAALQLADERMYRMKQSKKNGNPTSLEDINEPSKLG